MPLYLYKCPSCHEGQEVYLPFPITKADDHYTICKSCDVAMERVPTAASFEVRGFNARNGYAKETP